MGFIYATMELALARVHTADRTSFLLFLDGAKDARPRHLRQMDVGAVKPLVRVLYASSQPEDRVALARAFIWGDDETRFLLGRRWDVVGDREEGIWSDRDLEDSLPLLLELALEAGDLDTLREFAAILYSNREPSDEYYEDQMLHSWLDDAIAANPEMHIRFPGRVGRGTVNVLSRADRRGLGAQLPPCFFDSLREDIMRRRRGSPFARLGSAAFADFDAVFMGRPRTHHALIETFEAVGMVRKYFATPQREALVAKLLSDSSDSDCNFVASMTASGMTANLRAVILLVASEGEAMTRQRPPQPPQPPRQ